MKVRRDQIRQEREQERLQAQQEASTSDGRERATSSPDDTSIEDDIDGLEIDVPGWEEKGRWVFYLDLATGTVPSGRLLCCTDPSNQTSSNLSFI